MSDWVSNTLTANTEVMAMSETLDTTLGDLILVLTEEAKRFVKDEEEMYKLVALILEHLLANVNTISHTSH